jgi:acetoin utilization protein AcuB
LFTVAFDLLTRATVHVDDLMSRSVITVAASESCHDAVTRMARAGVRHLPVVDAGGRPIGIVTDRDLRHRLFRPGVFREIGSLPVESLLKGITVAEIMSAPVVAVAPSDDLETAARLMVEERVGSLPVVEGGRVVGIVTETDLLRRIVQADACCREVETIIVSYP